jgi:DNA-binding MarR family transcriptional regulator
MNEGQKPLPAASSAEDHLLRLVHSTSAASRQLRRRLCEVAQAYELSDTELLVVWLCKGGGRVQVELAGAIGVSPAQMSGIVERLRARGLVEMHRPAADRRRQVWRSSRAGQALLEQAEQKLHELTVLIRSDLSNDEQHTAQALCERLAQALAIGSRRTTGKSSPPATHDEQRASKEAA